MSTHDGPNQLVLPFEPGLPLPARHPGLVDIVDAELLDDLHRRLGRFLGEPIDLIGTRNRRTIVSWRRLESGLLRVRCLRQFAMADDEVIQAVAQFVRSRDPAAREILQRFSMRVRPHDRRPQRPRFAAPFGKHHDLQGYFDAENQSSFEGDFRARIGWSVGSRGKERRSIRLGSWMPEHRLIKVHPVLDREAVPGYVVGFVVFHEMLHGVLGAAQHGRRRVFHTTEFRAREADHPNYHRAQDWIAGNMDALLSY